MDNTTTDSTVDHFSLENAVEMDDEDDDNDDDNDDDEKYEYEYVEYEYEEYFDEDNRDNQDTPINKRQKKCSDANSIIKTESVSNSPILRFKHNIFILLSTACFHQLTSSIIIIIIIIIIMIILVVVGSGSSSNRI
jgi:hypothetical protein